MALRLLVESQADVNQADNDGESPTCCAARNGHCDALQLLVESKADVDQSTCNGHTPTMICVCYGQAAALQVMLEAKADASKQLKEETALQQARKAGEEECVRVLQAAGVVE